MARAGTWTAGRRQREYADGDGEAHPAVLHAPTRGPGLPYVTQLDATPAAGCLGRWTAAPRRGPVATPTPLRPGAASSCTADRIVCLPCALSGPQMADDRPLGDGASASA